MRWITLFAVCVVFSVGYAEEEKETKKEKETGTEKKAPGLTGVLSEEGFKALHELTEKKRPKLHGEMVEVGDMKAYLSVPKQGKAPFPAVLVIHEWWGLNVHIKHWADRLAADGYAALAVDLYEGNVATTRDDAMTYMRGVDAEKAIARLKAAHTFLAKDKRVRATKRACVGWCFGGGWSLQLALAAPDLDLAVIYYGRLVTDADKLKAIKAKVVGVFGNQDRGIPPKWVNEFAAALKEAKVKHTIHRYDANHAFANPSSGRYDEKSAEAAWRKVRLALAETLKR